MDINLYVFMMFTQRKIGAVYVKRHAKLFQVFLLEVCTRIEQHMTYWLVLKCAQLIT